MKEAGGVCERKCGKLAVRRGTKRRCYPIVSLKNSWEKQSEM